jgi:hypothetical protein
MWLAHPPNRRDIMFRKLTIALGAAATLGAAALAPSSALAWHGHHGWHGGHGWGWGGFRGYRVGFYAPTYVAGPSCYVVKRWVDTPYGLQLRRFTVC